MRTLSTATEPVGTVEKVAIRADYDIVEVRRRLRELAEPLPYSAAELAMIATAVAELARNILEYAHEGEIALSLVTAGKRAGIRVVAHDDGPGIVDVGLAMRTGYSTSEGLGLGLPGSKRLVDEFEIESRAGAGTTVQLTKWAQRT